MVFSRRVLGGATIHVCDYWIQNIRNPKLFRFYLVGNYLDSYYMLWYTLFCTWGSGLVAAGLWAFVGNRVRERYPLDGRRQIMAAKKKAAAKKKTAKKKTAKKKTAKKKTAKKKTAKKKTAKKKKR